MKINSMFNLIKTAQYKLSIIETTILPADFIIIRDALFEANNMRITLGQISKMYNYDNHPSKPLSHATRIASKALKLPQQLEHERNYTTDQILRKLGTYIYQIGTGSGETIYSSYSLDYQMRNPLLPPQSIRDTKSDLNYLVRSGKLMRFKNNEHDMMYQYDPSLLTDDERILCELVVDNNRIMKNQQCLRTDYEQNERYQIGSTG